MRWRLGLILLCLALNVLLTHWPAGWQPVLETVYGEQLYPRVQSALSGLPQPRYFALADLLWLAVPLVLFIRLLILWRRNLIRRFTMIGLESLLWANLLYLLMMLSWGLNYQRPTLYAHLQNQGFTTRLVEGHWQFALDQTRQALTALPDSYRLCTTGLFYPPERPSAFMHSAMAIANLTPAGSRRVQMSAWSPVYTRLGIAGVYIPFTGEPTVNRALFNPSLPFVMTHEVAHWVGYAHEYDADILAYWSLWQAPDPQWAISAWLVWWHEINAPDAIQEQLPVALQNGLTCYRDHLRSQPRWRIQKGLWQVYEANLNNQGVQGGLKSYSMGEAMALSSYQDWLIRKQ